MNRILNTLLGLLAVCGTGVATAADFRGPDTQYLDGFQQDQEIKVVKLNELMGSELNEIMEGKRFNVAIEFPAETHLPIRFYLRGDLATLMEENQDLGTLEIKQTVYARWVEEDFMLSLDLLDWKPALEFITGNASIGFGVQEEGPFAFVGADVNRRQ